MKFALLGYGLEKNWAAMSKSEQDAKFKDCFAPAADTKAMQFASLGYIDENGWDSISKDELQGMLGRCVAFDETRVKSGQWLSGIRLQSAWNAKILRTKAGRVVVTDGPFAETKEHLGGVVVLRLKDLNDAVALLSKHPALPFGVAMEIRPIDAETSRRWKARLGQRQTG